MAKTERTPLMLAKSTNNLTKRYYLELERLERLYEEDRQTISGEKSKDEQETNSDALLSKLVFAANILLLLAKIAATYFSGGTSLSIISTLLDSVVDITSSIGIWYTSNAILTSDSFQYPRGRDNLELISFIFIGLIMGMANLYVMFKSILRIMSLEEAPDIGIISLVILLGTIITKGVMWLACRRHRSPSARVLAIDQRNDVLTNAVGMAGAIAATYLTPYADPVAACLIAGYIAFSWSGVVLEQVPMLAGTNCTKEEFSRVLRVLITTVEKVKMVETLLIYHTGLRVRVEAHVVLDAETPAKVVHDEVEEPLKRALEKLNFVERAFVHPDYECDGFEP